MFDVSLPEMTRIQQVMPAPFVEDIPAEMIRQIDLVCPSSLNNRRIAITAGSRGINNMPLVLRTLVEELKKRGAKPFLVPAMGSHGGASAEGQIEVLRTLGITPETIGAPIESSMEVEQIGITEHDIPVYVDKKAVQADGIVVVNRIKAHTEFSGEIESGLYKMMVIGLGKQKGASTAHSYALRRGYARVFKEVGDVVLQHLPVLFGIALLENCFDQTAEIQGVAPQSFFESEKKLLVRAKEWMMRLPVNKIDLLIIDEMGKAFSGSGMDTNIVGRIMVYGQEEYTEPDIIRILVLDINEHSHGNATGIGIADFTTQRLADQIDWPSTIVNCVTACAPEKARLPMILATDREAVDVALSTTGLEDTTKARVVHIKNTLDLSEIEVSASLWAELEANQNLSKITSLETMRFDSENNLLPI